MDVVTRLVATKSKLDEYFGKRQAAGSVREQKYFVILLAKPKPFVVFRAVFESQFSATRFIDETKFKLLLLVTHRCGHSSQIKLFVAFWVRDHDVARLVRAVSVCVGHPAESNTLSPDLQRLSEYQAARSSAPHFSIMTTTALRQLAASINVLQESLPVLASSS